MAEIVSSTFSLWGDQWEAAFAQGAAVELVRRRNPAIGHLLNSERASFYIQILYRLLLFRRTHELEPLHDDIYEAVRTAQSFIAGGVAYSDELFNQDLRQLRDWGVVEERMEKERLRGYRDARKRKFRYRLKPETMAFLLWLEERLQDDLEEKGNDARSLLEDVVGTLHELLRLLHKLQPAQAGDQEARRILFQLANLDAITLEINTNLSDFNARLLLFMQQSYDIAESMQILREIEKYLDVFLGQIHRLRKELLPALEAVGQEKLMAKIQFCEEIMEKERRQTPHLLKSSRNQQQLTTLPMRLLPFYADDGIMDQLCHRINVSSLEVWKRLRAHLRELERKNHRLEDIHARVIEISSLHEDKVPHRFFCELLSPVMMLTDMNYWDATEKATPPQPHRITDRHSREIRNYLPRKVASEQPVQSMDDERLEYLRYWLQDKIEPSGNDGNANVSCGNYDKFDDLPRIMELAKAGLLSNGRRLKRIQRSLSVKEEEVEVEIAHYRMAFKEMSLRKEG